MSEPECLEFIEGLILINYYLYSILCETGSLYTGVTTNLERRFAGHSSKSVGWHTKLYSPIERLYSRMWMRKTGARRRRVGVAGEPSTARPMTESLTF